MQSPLSVPGVASIYDEIPKRRTRSFDALDLCYSEVVSMGSFPLVGRHVAFIPASADGPSAEAPMEDIKTPEPPSAEASMEDIKTPEACAMNSPIGREGQRLSLLEQERSLVVIDYDLSDEEDEILQTSYDTAPISNFQLQREGVADRRDSFSEFVATSPIVCSVSKSIQDSSDLVVPSLQPVTPIRRESSTPIVTDRQRAGASTPPLGPGRIHSPPQRRSTAVSISTPYPFQRHASLPVTADERMLPAILFTDDSQAQGTPKDRNRGASVFRIGRFGNLASPSGRTPPSKLTVLPSPLASKYRYEDSLPSPKHISSPPPSKRPILHSPLARKYRYEDTLPKHISSPFAFRRQTSLPVTAVERSSEPTICFATTSEPLVGGESTLKDQNRGSGICRVGRSETPTSVASRGSTDSEKWVVIQENPTNNTVEDGSDEELAVNAMSPAVEEGNQKALMDDVDCNDGSPSEPSTRSDDDKPFFRRQKMVYVSYLSAFSVFGSTVRVFLGNLFGSDCETSEFCVTANGQTTQRGGALFTDLPANVVGCFIMGLMTSLKPDMWPPLPWLRCDHPLQQHDAYQVGIRTGLCGSLTTFASWNAQMILMMDGTGTQLGSQIVAAFFGYIIGFFCAVSSFMVGTHVSTWLTRWKNPEIAREDDEELRLNRVESIDHGEESLRRRHMSTLGSTPPQRIIVLPQFLSSENQFCHHWRALFCSARIPFVILVVLLAAYAIVGFSNDNEFYRTLFFTSLFSPGGALLRWELYQWNSRIAGQRSRRMNWLPWGTFVANVLASCVSSVLLALQMRENAVNNIWAVNILSAMRTGFAGSLSTVSTLVKELFDLHSKFPHHAKAYHYAALTVVSSLVLCLCLYSAIVRLH